MPKRHATAAGPRPIAGALQIAYAPAFLPGDLAEACLMLVEALFVLDPPPEGWEPPG